MVNWLSLGVSIVSLVGSGIFNYLSKKVNKKREEELDEQQEKIQKIQKTLADNSEKITNIHEKLLKELKMSKYRSFYTELIQHRRNLLKIW